jgi:hypothetical protein
VGKLIFGEKSPPSISEKINELSKKKVSSKNEAFNSNFSENIMRTVSPIPSLSPRTPQMYSKSPQAYSKSPQLMKRFTDIYSKSPKVYSGSPYYSNCNHHF